MSAVLLEGASRLKSLSLEAQAKLRSAFESRHIIAVVTALILLNALILGLETYPAIMVVAGSYLRAADQVILAIFVAELVLRAYAYGRQFLRDPWSLFDAAVISVAFMPTNEAFAVLRAARVLRVLRLISILPRLRAVIEGWFAPCRASVRLAPSFRSSFTSSRLWLQSSLERPIRTGSAIFMSRCSACSRS